MPSAGAVAGQVAVAPFLLWRDATPLAEGLACSAWVAPFFLPLYLLLGVPALAVGVGRRLPQLLAGVALLTGLFAMRVCARMEDGY